MSEQKQLEAIDEAFKTIAQWADINVDELRNYSAPHVMRSSKERVNYS